MARLFNCAVLVLALSAPVTAQDLEDSVWCTADGERHFIERQGLGFNEHTVCTVRSWHVDGSSVSTVQNCENIYVGDDGSVTRLNPQTISLRIMIETQDSIRVQQGDRPDTTYSRC